MRSRIWTYINFIPNILKFLRYLFKSLEITLDSNATNVLQFKNEKFRNGFTISFCKIKDIKKIPVTNGKVIKKNTTLLNGVNDKKKQVCNIFKASKTSIDINN